jgi:hypothetical protein
MLGLRRPLFALISALLNARIYSAMHKYLLVLLSCVWFGFGGEGPPGCQALNYFGVQGCQLSAQGTCPKGYHKQLACPTNPAIKAPCRQMCVADPVPGKKVKLPETGRQR